MMRTPTRSGGGGKSKARTVFLPAPIGGWNARDPISMMPPTDAVILDNLIPDAGHVRLRGEATLFATIQAGGDVKSLFSYLASDRQSGNKIFAATSAAIYDISAGGTISSASLTVATTGLFSTAQITTSAGTYLYICEASGASNLTPRYFDGSNWNTSTFSGSGLTLNDLCYVAVHMNRLWFVEWGTNNAWYAPVTAIAGTLTKFPVPFKRGGCLELILSWSRDGGAGPDDYLVFVSSNSEVLIYAGTDLSSSTTSALIGAFTIASVLPVQGASVQPKITLKAGGDVAIMTRLGVVGLSQLLGTAVSGTSQLSITDKISRAYQGNALTVGCIEEYPEDSLVFVNASPTADASDSTLSMQFVLNTKTQQWCRFTGMDAYCLHRWVDTDSANPLALDPAVYMGRGSGAIYRYASSNSADMVQTRLVHAFSDFGTPNRKRFLQARPRLHMTASGPPIIAMCLDYVPTLPTSTTLLDTSTTAPSKWLGANWHTDLNAINHWQGVAGVGFAGAPAMQFKINSAATQGGGFLYHGCDVTFEIGGSL
jgi:hypothetical protein